MLYINESKIPFPWSGLVLFHLQCPPVCAFRFVWNNNWNTVNTVVVCQGTKVNLGWRETHEFRDIWHPSQAQPRKRWLPWPRFYGTPWQQGATTEQGFFWDTQRRSTWFPRRQRRAGFFRFRIQGKLLRHSVARSMFKKKCLFEAFCCLCVFLQKDNKVAA